MNQSTKISHCIVVLVFFMLISIVYIIQVNKQSNKIVQSIEPTSQLAQVVNPVATLSLSPASQSVSVGGTFTANILLDTGGRAAYGVDVNRLNFNPSILQVVDVDLSAAGVQISAGSLMPVSIINTVDNTAGNIQFSQVATPGSTFTGSGTVATITFRVVAAGTSNVNFDFVLGRGTDSNVAGLGGDLLASVNGGSYTGTVADNIAPTISNIVLSGVSMTGATITWSTADESSDTQVEYGLTSAYGSLSTLSTTMSTNHSVILTGLSAGTTYNYRVKSRDAAGNLAVSANNIFTTVSSPDITAPTVPSGLTATPTGETQIQLSWTASVDTAGLGQNSSGVSGYQVFRSGTLLDTVSTTAYLDKGLTADTTYNYQITAVDIAGNVSAKSASVSGTTQALSSNNVQRKIVLTLEGVPNTNKAAAGTIDFLNPSTKARIFQSSITTDIFGQYIMNIPAGLIATVTLRPIIPGYISKLIANVDLRNTTVLEVNFPTLPAGDFNGDQMINSLDFSYLNGKWGSTDALADIDRNSQVNALDFSYLSNNWLLVGE